jgi:hypothetical protein
MIGKINDDISILARAIDYIQSGAKRLQEHTGRVLKVTGIEAVATDQQTGRRRGWQKGCLRKSPSGTWTGHMYVRGGDRSTKLKKITFSGLSEDEARAELDRLIERERDRRMYVTVEVPQITAA